MLTWFRAVLGAILAFPLAIISAAAFLLGVGFLGIGVGLFEVCARLLGLGPLRLLDRLGQLKVQDQATPPAPDQAIPYQGADETIH